MPEECIFCRIVKEELPCCPVYQDNLILAFLDINPISQGHCLVIPKAHYNLFHQCPPELVADLAGKLGKIAQAVVESVDAQSYNILNNNGRPAGQLVDHFHFHIIPRRADDGVFNRWPAGKYPPGFMEQLADKINQEIIAI